MRQRLSLDRDWRFAIGHAANPAADFEFARDRSLVKAGEARGAAGIKFDDSSWKVVNVPHDWAVELPLDPKGDKELCDHGFLAIGPDHPEHSVGWYRRRFRIPRSDVGRRISIEFDGVFRDCIVWINGHRLGRHASGYTSFRYDITDYLNYGAENVVAVRADASQYEGWWYEGAGIYRHVWLVKTDPVHVAADGTFVTTEIGRGSAKVTIRTTIVNDSDDRAIVSATSTVARATSPCPEPSNRRHGLVARATVERVTVEVSPWSQTDVVQTISFRNPKLWSPDEPNLYTLHTTLSRGRRVVDEYNTTFGIRSTRWDARRGFFLNGKPLKIKGTCNHQQFAGVGIAQPDALHEFRLRKLKAMGSNAYRCSHYMVSRELLDACDRLGFLVMAETRRAGSAGEAIEQLETMIRRDRNHPSIILWSIGNEEHSIQWSIAGERIGRSMVRRAHELDPTRPVTAAMHDKGLGVGFANVVDVHGWNYMNVGDIEAFHKRRPRQPIVGSEEASTLCTRGIYADDESRGYVAAYDRRAPKWGSRAEEWWPFFAARRWLAGAFVWIGFDHRGEPIPYKWPCTLSHFGLMDFCGFEKDNYFYYQACWSDRDVLHLFPHWNWPGQDGREIDVRCFSNLDRVELVLNGRSMGAKDVPRNSHVAWKVPYEPGVLEARGYRGRKLIATSKRQTSGEPARIVLAADRSTIRADGEDVAMITASVVDALDRPVPTAGNLIRFTITGAGHLLGVGNGDPSSHESDRSPQRRLFNGLALAIVQSDRKPGSIRIVAESEGLAAARLTIGAQRVALRREA